jgi:membrane-bound ClpP family serine protease
MIRPSTALEEVNTIARCLPLLGAVIANLLAAPVWAQDARTVIRFPIVQTIPDDLGLRMRQLVSEAHDIDAGAIILDLDVWEGEVDRAADAVAEMDASEVPVYALVTGVALNTGMLLALAADSIFMVPDALLGGRLPEEEGFDADSLLNALRALGSEFRILAQRRGYDADVIAAMADPSVTILGGADSTVVLSLDADAAEKNGLAFTVRGVDEMLERLGLGQAELLTASVEGLTDTTVRIRNNSWRDVRVYLMRGGSRQRLGLVTSMRQVDFSLAYRVSAGGAEIRLLVEPVGTSESLATDLIRPLPGLVIQWDIHNNLAMSSYSLIRP